MGVRRRRVLVDDVEQDYLHRPLERQLAAEQLVQDYAETVLVAGREGLAAFSLGLLRGHVAGRADDGAVVCQVLRRFRATRAAGLGLVGRGTGPPGRRSVVGQAEVHEVGFAVVVQHDVGRLDVAVNDSQAVGVGQGLGQVAHRLGRLGEVDVAAVHGPRQGAPLDEGGGDEVVRPVVAGIVNRDNVRVAQPGCRPGLAQEALDLAVAFRLVALRDLEGDFAVQLRVVGAIDGAEGTRPQTGPDLEAPDVAGPRGGGCRLRLRRAGGWAVVSASGAVADARAALAAGAGPASSSCAVAEASARGSSSSVSAT